MAQQILFIHGGNCFDAYESYLDFLRAREISKDDLVGKKKWRHILQADLGEDYEVFLPQFPCAWNAKYVEWKIWFEKFIPFLKDDIILIGGSLGGIFLAKYFSENDFPIKIRAILLLAAPFDAKNREVGYSLVDFVLPESLEKLEKQVGKIFLYHSKDDPIVPFADVEKYATKLPSAEKVIFEDKGHFILEEFPEIVEKLRSIK
jgi:predicted alpha/beta hydrolase family esterase